MSAAPTPPGTVAWVDLSTPDVDGAADFYAALLGWELQSEETSVGRYVIGMVPAGPAAGVMAPSDDDAGMPPAWTVFVSVADIDASFALAVDAGGAGLQPPMEIPGGDRIAVVLDPAGAVIGMMQPTSEGGMARGDLGTVAWVDTASRHVAASRAFYGKVFGWTASDSPTYTIFTCDGEEVAGLMEVPPGVPDEVPAYWLVYFAVGDVDATVARAVELGGVIAAPPMTVETMRFAVIEDPTGATFAVLHGA
jgi:predicted enzyme related to lactoylglutathione lyase